MKRFGLFCLSVAMFVVCNGVADEKDAKFDAAKLDGKWKITAGTKFGEKVEGASLEGPVVIKKDAFQILDKEGKVEHEMTFTLDTKATPIAITMKGTIGPAKDLTAEGIIELKGEELKLCYSMPGEKRPTKFGSEKDSKVLYFVMKKDK